MVVTPISGRPIQERFFSVACVGFQLTIWIPSQGTRRNIINQVYLSNVNYKIKL